MVPLLPAPTTALVLASTCAAGVLLLRLCLPSWWKLRAVRLSAIAATVPAWVGIILWQYSNSYALAHLGVVITWGTLIPLALAVVALPFAGLIRWLAEEAYLSRAPSPMEPTRFRLFRRDFLVGASVAVPAAASGLGGYGFWEASQAPTLPVIPMTFPHLPAGLEGMSILLLSDIHLGSCATLDDLEALLGRARRLSPDMVVLAGDLADDVMQITPALRLIASFPAPLGAYAALGNHEYLRDITTTMPLFRASPVPLLRNSHIPLTRKGSRLIIAGVDDPFADAHANRMDPRVAMACRGAPKDAFRILLSHRPWGIEAACRHGVDLTLSGHTHGGQVAVQGRDRISSLHPDRYVWGKYQVEASRLYVSSGMSHWFPFRIGCPAEVPLIVLRSS